MRELVKDKPNIVVFQVYGKRFNPLKKGYERFKKGKEYWLLVKDDILATKRAKGKWGFGHKCCEKGVREMRRSPKGDEYMKCTSCGKTFPPREELERLARASFPDELTIRFLVGLS